ncbi:MAG: hypothetical protein IIC01_08485 [Planctomycetes bacterium]|nr:hypothetical protein [Planctomycetota bacterium]
MRRLVGWVVGVCCASSAAMATDISISVESMAGLHEITVAPGAEVQYRVVGILSDMDNEGLALVGFDLEFEGGPLSQADTPRSTVTGNDPMAAFVIPDGITNPAGYGGTIIDGKLVQIGGGLNTIKNGQQACTDAADCPTGSFCELNVCTQVAAFPLGMVITGIAEPAPDGMGPAVLVTGSLTAPETPGSYILQSPRTSIFANVIKAGETGDIFWATVAAGVAGVQSLTINVEQCSLASSSPPNCAIDARFPHEPNNAGAALGWSSVDFTFSCSVSNIPNLDPSDFVVSVSPTGTPPTVNQVISDGFNTVTLELSSPIETGKYTCFAHSQGTVCLGSLPGDVSASGVSDGLDIMDLIDFYNTGSPALTLWQCDIDRDGTCAPADLLGEIDLLLGTGAFAEWRNVSFGVSCPSGP